MKRLFLYLLCFLTCAMVGAQTATIRNVWYDHNVISGNQRCLAIHIDLTIYNAYNKSGLIVAYMHNADGTPVKDRNREYYTTEGNVSTSNNWRGLYVNNEWKDYVLYIPNYELHPYDGDNDYYFDVYVFCDGRTLTSHKGGMFSMEGNYGYKLPSSSRQYAQSNTSSSRSSNNSSSSSSYSPNSYASSSSSSNGKKPVGKRQLNNDSYEEVTNNANGTQQIKVYKKCITCSTSFFARAIPGKKACASCGASGYSSALGRTCIMCNGLGYTNCPNCAMPGSSNPPGYVKIGDYNSANADDTSIRNAMQSARRKIENARVGDKDGDVTVKHKGISEMQGDGAWTGSIEYSDGGRYTATAMECLMCNHSGKCARCNGLGYNTLQGTGQVLPCSVCFGAKVCQECKGTKLRFTTSRMTGAQIKEAVQRYQAEKMSSSSSSSSSNNNHGTITGRPRCSICLGSGRCTWCAGRGEKQSKTYGTYSDCDLCRGTGRCQSCYGSGESR